MSFVVRGEGAGELVRGVDFLSHECFRVELMWKRKGSCHGHESEGSRFFFFFFFFGFFGGSVFFLEGGTKGSERK